MKEITKFIDISKYAGERFDLIQAGGGNSSVKLDNGQMIIKASGYLLSDMGESTGYSKVKTGQIVNILKNKTITSEVDQRMRENLTSTLVYEANIDKRNRPSIETLLHSLLYKYTLHTHPVVVNMIVIQKQWRELLLSIFKDDEIALVSYHTPGIDLAIELDKVLQTFDDTPKIIFLQNHGLIVTSENNQDISRLTDYVLSKVENFLNIDMSKYKLTNKITSLLNSVHKSNNISYLSEDSYLNNQLNKIQDFINHINDIEQLQDLRDLIDDNILKLIDQRIHILNSSELDIDIESRSDISYSSNSSETSISDDNDEDIDLYLDDNYENIFTANIILDDKTKRFGKRGRKLHNVSNWIFLFLY